MGIHTHPLEPVKRERNLVVGGGGEKSLLSCNRCCNCPGPEFQQGSVSTCSAAPAPTPHIHHPPPPFKAMSAPCAAALRFRVIRRYSPLGVSWKGANAQRRRTRTCVCAVMRFEVGTLGVGLPTAHVVARVRGHPLPRPGAPTALGLGFLCQGVPAGDHEGLCGVESP